MATREKLQETNNRLKGVTPRKEKQVSPENAASKNQAQTITNFLLVASCNPFSFKVETARNTYFVLVVSPCGYFYDSIDAAPLNLNDTLLVRGMPSPAQHCLAYFMVVFTKHTSKMRF